MEKHLQQLQTEVAAAVAGLDARLTQATPNAHPEKWSIQQIVEHLLITWRTTTPALRLRIEKGAPTRATPTLRQRVGQFRILTLGSFPSGRASPAAVSPTLPSSLRSGEELTEQVQSSLAELDRTAEEAEVLFGNRRAVSHMLLGPMSISGWRQFHLIHGRHHIQQIAAIRRDNSF